MDRASTANEVSPDLVVRIVRGYVTHNRLGPSELAGLIAEVHRSLGGLGKSESEPAPLVPAVPVKRSVQRDYVVCLDCGFRSKMLRGHVRTAHGLEPVDYRARWKLSANHPLTAPSYSERRSAMAKHIGLGGKRLESAVPPPAPEVVVRPRKRGGRKPRSAPAA